MPLPNMIIEGETKLPLSPSATLVLMLAGGAMPFAGSAEDEAQRWLRVLRLHGDAGRALQALGVGEQPLVEELPSPERETVGSAACARKDALGRRAVPVVVAAARRCATGRSMGWVGTPELLVAVIQAYGELFTEELHTRGTSAGELLECVASRRSATA